MATSTRNLAWVLPLLALLSTASMTGCSALQGNPSMALDQQVADEPDSITDPMVVVELRDGDNKREYLRAPLTETMLVQDALKGSGAISRFRRMEVVLVRQVAGNQKLKLPVRFDPRTRRVAPQHNYAVHAGDWLKVTEDTSTMFDRMIESALEPIRPMMRDYRD